MVYFAEHRFSIAEDLVRLGQGFGFIARYALNEHNNGWLTFIASAAINNVRVRTLHLLLRPKNTSAERYTCIQPDGFIRIPHGVSNVFRHVPSRLIALHHPTLPHAYYTNPLGQRRQQTFNTSKCAATTYSVS